MADALPVDSLRLAVMSAVAMVKGGQQGDVAWRECLAHMLVTDPALQRQSPGFIPPAASTGGRVGRGTRRQGDDV